MLATPTRARRLRLPPSRRPDCARRPTPTDAPTDVPTDVPTAVPTAAPTDTPEVKFKLDVVQWVQNQAGDNIAVVRDNQGILWYVWGDDVPRIEQGLSPQYQPVPVNQVGPVTPLMKQETTNRAAQPPFSRHGNRRGAVALE